MHALQTVYVLVEGRGRGGVEKEGREGEEKEGRGGRVEGAGEEGGNEAEETNLPTTPKASK